MLTGYMTYFSQVCDMSDRDGEGEAPLPTPAPRKTAVASSHVHLPPPHFDPSSSCLFSSFAQTWLAYIYVTKPPVSKQLAILLLC